MPEQETFEQFFDAVTGGSWADPADPHRRVADALRRLSHRSVVHQPDRDANELTVLADRLEALLDGPEHDAAASR